MFTCASDTFCHTKSSVYAYFYVYINVYIHPDVETDDDKILSFSKSGYLFL